MFQITHAVLLCVLVAPGAPVQAAPSANGEVHAAFQKLQATLAELDARQKKLIQEFRKAPRDDQKARDAAIQAMQGIRKERSEATETFRVVFEKCDWNSLDPGKNASLLEKGLMAVAEQASEKNPARAAEAYEAVLAKIPESAAARSVRGYLLPSALISTGKLDHALKRVGELAAGSKDEAERRNLQITLGDIHCARGETSEGVALYRKAVDGLDADLARTDPRSGARRNADLRLALVGQPAPDIAAPTWVGGKPHALSELRGNVCVVDFWATWCGPCRSVMPSLDHLYREHRGAPFRLVGVTRFYESGFLPDGPAMEGGSPVRGITEETFVDHLEKFRKASGISYPFAVGSKKDFENYKVTGIPTVVVVGPDGRVLLVTVGSGSEALVRTAVDGALARLNG